MDSNQQHHEDLLKPTITKISPTEETWRVETRRVFTLKVKLSSLEQQTSKQLNFQPSQEMPTISTYILEAERNKGQEVLHFLKRHLDFKKLSRRGLPVWYFELKSKSLHRQRNRSRRRTIRERDGKYLDCRGLTHQGRMRGLGTTLSNEIDPDEHRQPVLPLELDDRFVENFFQQSLVITGNQVAPCIRRSQQDKLLVRKQHGTNERVARQEKICRVCCFVFPGRIACPNTPAHMQINPSNFRSKTW